MGNDLRVQVVGVGCGGKPEERAETALIAERKAKADIAGQCGVILEYGQISYFTNGGQYCVKLNAVCDGRAYRALPSKKDL